MSLQPTDKKEIANIISSLNSNNSSGSNSIPYRTFFKKMKISKPLADLFKMVLKSAKVVSVFNKDSKLDYSNYR